jgi:dTDP-4-amino-4,6-dideoxygalactose transaminase
VGATLARAGHVLATRRWRRWTFPLRRLVRKGGSSTPGLAPTYRRERMANLDAAVARTLLSGLENNVEARRQRVRWYGELLADVPGVALVPHRAGSACTKQVVLLDPARGEAPAEALAAFLDAAGYEVAPAYRPLHLVDGYRELSRGHLRTAESVAGRLLELPTEPSVSSLDIERLCGLVRAWAMA